MPTCVPGGIVNIGSRFSSSVFFCCCVFVVFHSFRVFFGFFYCVFVVFHSFRFCFFFFFFFFSRCNHLQRTRTHARTHARTVMRIHTHTQRDNKLSSEVLPVHYFESVCGGFLKTGYSSSAESWSALDCFSSGFLSDNFLSVFLSVCLSLSLPVSYTHLTLPTKTLV